MYREKILYRQKHDKKQPFLAIKTQAGLSLIEFIISLLISGIILALLAPSISAKGVFYNNFLNKNKLLLKAQKLESTFRSAKSSGDELYSFGHVRLENEELVFFILDLRKMYYNNSKFLNACPRELFLKSSPSSIKAYLVVSIDGEYVAEVNRANRKQCLEGELLTQEESSYILLDEPSHIHSLKNQSRFTLIPLKNIYSISRNSKGELIKRYIISDHKQVILEGVEKLTYKKSKQSNGAYLEIEYKISGLNEKSLYLNLNEKKGSLLDVIF